MISKRKLVFENGSTCFIEDQENNTVSFFSVKDFNRCTGLDFTGKFYVGYEPDIDLFIDSEDPTFTSGDIPYAPYEGLIDNVLVLQERLADPSYGLPEEEGKAALENQRQVERATEYVNRYFLLTGTKEAIKLQRGQGKYMKALRKETKGTASQKDIDYLEAADALDDLLDDLDSFNDDLERYIEDPVRTLQELRDLDVTDDIWWT